MTSNQHVFLVNFGASMQSIFSASILRNFVVQQMCIHRDLVEHTKFRQVWFEWNNVVISKMWKFNLMYKTCKFNGIKIC